MPLLLAGWVLLLSSVFRGTLGAPEAFPSGDPGATELDRIRWETRILRMEAELASGNGPYLVLDLPRGLITLKFQGVALREYPILDSSIRTRHRAGLWGNRSAPLDSIWGEGTLTPAIRRKHDVIYSDSVTPPDPSGTVESIPPSPEEAAPLPPSFRIRFPGRLSVAVTPASTGEEEGSTGSEGRPSRLHLIHWLRMKPWQPDLARLDLTMSDSEAGSFYRAFSHGTPMMVVGWLQGAAGSGSAPGGADT